MDWNPPHRRPVALPGPWPACAQALLRDGAAWLHTGQDRPGDRGGDLLALPGGPRLETRWDGSAWVTTREGRRLPEAPWEALDAFRSEGLPLVGAATFELACAEGGHAHQSPPAGFLGQRWIGVREALRVEGSRAELWSWGAAPPDPPAWGAACALGRLAFQLHPRWEASRHGAALAEAQARIREGGFYVANLCVPFEGPFTGDPITLALAAFRRARPPYGAFLPWGDPTLLCLSMERLLARRGDRLWTEPIKGSLPLTSERGALAADPKEKAEHTMIVDLQRNDLGRVSRAGSVRVTRLRQEEDYATVRHLVSCVEGELRDGLGLPDILRALLPGGSVTGAPKHAVCDWLAATEEGPRGFYCGALGWIHPNGDFDLCMPIRTAQLQEGHLTYWAGGGLTRRSDPAREWEELHLKTRALTQIMPSGGVRPCD